MMPCYVQYNKREVLPRFELGLTDSESDVLPLHHRTAYIRLSNFFAYQLGRSSSFDHIPLQKEAPLEYALQVQEISAQTHFKKNFLDSRIGMPPHLHGDSTLLSLNLGGFPSVFGRFDIECLILPESTSRGNLRDLAVMPLVYRYDTIQDKYHTVISIIN